MGLMVKSFEEAEIMAAKVGPKRISVLRAENREFLLALKESYRRGYVEPILIGDASKIREIADDIDFDIGTFLLIDEKSQQKIADKGVRLVSEGKSDLILRGHIDGHYVYRALIRHSAQTGARRQICVVALMQMPVLPKFIGLVDPGITVAPDFHAKMAIIQNAVDLFSHLGYENPRVGILTAHRRLNAELDSVLDAMKIRDAQSRGELTGCIIEEGLSLSDFFLGKSGFLENHGDIDFSFIPDILLAHNIEFANIFSKLDSMSTIDYFPRWERHGIVTGADAPAIIPSRADKHDAIVTIIALGVLIS